MERNQIDYNAIAWEELVSYEENSPTFLRWKIEIRSGKRFNQVNVKAGDIAGSFPSGNRWRSVGVFFKNKRYYAHRIIWILHNGSIDNNLVIDHIDGDYTNNNINNLRLVTVGINNKNKKKYKSNSTDITGVWFRTIKCLDYFIAGWYENGKLKSKAFSCSKLGYVEAKQQAKNFRESKIEDLNKNGEGYSQRHINN